MNGLYDIERFIDAQNDIYSSVIAELKAGRKQGHWMWYVFPQIKGLGSSAMANRYAISSMKEAEYYANHPILGARLRECTQYVIDIENGEIRDIFGYPDDLKFRSCMTLFERADKKREVYEKALNKYFDGQPDKSTLDILDRMS